MNSYELYRLADIDFDKFIRIKKIYKYSYKIKNCIYKLKSAGFKEVFDVPQYKIVLTENGQVVSTKTMNQSTNLMYLLITGHTIDISIDSINELINILKFRGNIRNFKLRRIIALNPVIEVQTQTGSKYFRS